MNVRDDAWLHAPTLEMIEARALRERVSVEEAWKLMEEQRARVLDRQKDDPFRYALEPPIWLVSDALEDFPWCTVDTERMLDKRFGWTWDQYKREMRKHLGFDAPVRSILDTGANRSAKSWRAVKRALMTASKCAADRVVMLVHETQERSRNDQQSLVWEMMPKEWRVQQRTTTTWIHYNRQNGFSNDKLTLPNLVQVRFHFYTQECKKTLEGSKPIRANLDEGFLIEWLETMERRCAQFNGVVHCTFTPVSGWTDGIAAFVEGSEPVKQIPAYLLPRDGGDPLPWMAAGLTQAEWRELEQAERDKRPARAPQSRPQDCLAWLEGKNGMPEAPANRDFEMAPRVSRCKNPQRAVVYFGPCDNPYSQPRNLMTRLLASGVDAGRENIRKAVYSIVRKAWASQFPKFDTNRHVIPAGMIPRGGTNWMFHDPAGGRNDFLLWVKKVGKMTYVYREWPGNYHIPGVGVPEAWTVPSSKGGGKGNDGARGEAQRSWGFGHLRMKFEMARLERWKAWSDWANGNEDSEAIPDTDELFAWDQQPEDEEHIRMRWIDSRAATGERKEMDRVTTLYTDMEKLGLNYELAPGNDVMDGVKKINSALEAGTLFVCADCQNTIWTMKNWTNVDGQRGACKEPADCLRWYFDLDLEDAQGDAQTAGTMATRDAQEPARGCAGGWGSDGQRLRRRGWEPARGHASEEDAATFVAR